MKIKTFELTGAALDWAVAKAGGGAKDIRVFLSGHVDYGMFHYSTDWSQGGPIIERERIELKNWGIDGWVAHATDYAFRPGNDEHFAECYGPTALIAAMRCYCCSKLGDVVDIPEELCQQQKS